MNKQITIKNLTINVLDSGITEYVFDGQFFGENEINLLINKDEECYVIFTNLLKDTKVHLELKENSRLNLSIFLKKLDNTVKFDANLSQNAYINAYCADFSDGNNQSEFIFNLNSENAKCDWHLASLSSQTDNKNISVSVNHNFKNTTASVDNYGVCKGDSHLIFSGTSFIANGSHGSKTRQNAKIMVFDLKSDAVAKPILKIDENDVEASHAAVVGKINDEHMFYLTSRGISFNDARSLITLGYLKPILKGFLNEKYKSEISNLIEGKL